jgi:hypothetical protein
MAQVRFLDQVPVGVYNIDPTSGGGTIDIYQNGTLVSSSVPFINFSGSVELTSFDTNGITVYITSSGGSGTGFPFSGSAVITGSLVISGSTQPIVLQTLPVQSGPYVVTYNPETGIIGYVNSTSGTSGLSGSSGTAGVSGTSGTSGSNGSSGNTGISGTSAESGTSGSSGSAGSSGNIGANGTSAASGTSGTSGSSGSNGVTGENGTSAISGTSDLQVHLVQMV